MNSGIPQQHLFEQLIQQFAIVSPDLQTLKSILDVLFGGYLVFLEHDEQAPFVDLTPQGLVLGELEVDDNFGGRPVQQVRFVPPSGNQAVLHGGGDGSPPDGFEEYGQYLDDLGYG